MPTSNDRFQAASGRPDEIKEAATRAAQEYLATLDDAAFGAASPVTPKFISRSDPAAIWTRRCGSCGRRGEGEFRWALEIARAAGRDLAANPEWPADKSNGEGPQ